MLDDIRTAFRALRRAPAFSVTALVTLSLAAAAAAAILGSVLGEGFRYGAAGLAIGIPAAFAASRLLRTLVFGVKETDPALAVRQ